VNTSNAVFEDQGHAGNGGRFLKRRILTLRDPGAMEILPLKWAPQVPRTRERETTDPKPTMISPGKAIKPPIHLDGLLAMLRLARAALEEIAPSSSRRVY